MLEATAIRIVRRLGSRANYLFEEESRLEALTPNLLRGEVELAIEEEQAVTVEDILRRRTEIEYMAGNGTDECLLVQQILLAFIDSSFFDSRHLSYRERIHKILNLIEQEN